MNNTVNADKNSGGAAAESPRPALGQCPSAWALPPRIEEWCISGIHHKCPSCDCKCHKKSGAGKKREFKRRKPKLVQDYHREAEERLNILERDAETDQAKPLR